MHPIFKPLKNTTMINFENGEIQDKEAWRFEDLYKYIKSDDFYNYTKNTDHGRTGVRDMFRLPFHGISTYQQLIDMETKQTEYKNPMVIHTNNFETVADVAGSMVNMDAFLNGEPEDMYNFVYSDSNIVKDLNLFISLGWQVDSEDIRRASERIYKYILNKPANVYFNVTITTIFKYMNSGKVRELKVILSDSDSYMTDHCLNMLGSPVFFRWLMVNYVITKQNALIQPMPTNRDLIDFMTFDLETY